MPHSRRQFLATSVSALGLATVGRSLGPLGLDAWQQAPPTPVFTPIRRNVGFFTASGGTVGYLVNAAAVSVVDTQFANTAPLLIAGLNERSSNRPVDALINTHHHGDHVGGNLAFKGVARKVVAHAKAAEHMRTPPGRPAPTAEQLYPDTTFTDDWRLTLGDEVVRARHYGRAHTSGDAVITFERANVAHMGDLMFNRRHPVVDQAAGASLVNWIKVLERTVADHDAETIYIFGHAAANQPVTGSRAELTRMRDFLTAALDAVRAEMAGGKARDVVIAARPVAKGFEDQGPLTAPIMTTAFDELSGGGRV